MPRISERVIKMDFFGVRATEQKTATSPLTAQTGTLVVGTAPVHQVGGAVNKVVKLTSLAEAKAALGWSEDFGKYTLCEAVETFFELYGVAPLLAVNVLDPSKKLGEEKTDEVCAVKNGQVKLSGDVYPESITVKKEDTALIKGMDYDVMYSEGVCIIEALSDGAIDSDTTELKVSYKEVTFAIEDMTKAVVGGYNVQTGVSTGLELADHALFQTGVLPDLIIAPGFSHKEEVAAVMTAKAKCLGVVFRSFAVCDLPAEEGYKKAAETKEGTGAYRCEKERVCWPLLTREGKTYHFSTHLAALMAAHTAENNGIPCEPASNKALEADGTVLSDGTEVTLDLSQANYLRGKGITTALNFVNGFTAWGEYCASVKNDGTDDPKDTFCNRARMINYIANTIVCTFWERIDELMTARLAASIVDEVNIWLNGLAGDSSGALLGARCELKKEENPDDDLSAGIIRPHLYLAVPGPAQQIDFVLEYDTSYIKSLLG